MCYWEEINLCESALGSALAGVCVSECVGFSDLVERVAATA